MPSVHLIIKGRVQGVFYRATALEIAKKLGISGWIKNTGEGNVETMAAGDQEALKLFIEWCREGPPDAQVTDISISPVENEKMEGFKILR